MVAKMRVLSHIFKFHGLAESFKIAIKGIGYLFFYHRNMRIIFLTGVCALLAGIYLKLRGIELACLCITVTLVFMAEIFNTALELMIDMHTDKYHTLIKLVKDISAAVVLIASVNAVCVGYILIIKKILDIIRA